MEDDREAVEPIPGQMDIYECIAEAAGDPPQSKRKRTVQEVVRERLAKGQHDDSD